MTLYEALKSGLLKDAPFASQQLHVRTSDGKLGTVERVRYNETRGYLMVTLRHFNGELFDHEYVTRHCELLERRP